METLPTLSASRSAWPEVLISYGKRTQWNFKIKGKLIQTFIFANTAYARSNMLIELEPVVWIYNNVGNKKNDFTKCLMESCFQCAD